LPSVLYGYKTLFLTLREEYRLRVFENRVLRIFGPERVKVIGGGVKLQNEDANNLYSSSYIIIMIKSWRMRQGEHVYAWEISACKVPVQKPER
jgi:hypothetical protein